MFMSRHKYMKLLRSKAKNKKWAVVYRGRTINFGDSRYEDYTQHHDIARLRAYRKRHMHDHINDPSTPGFWAWHVLWSDKNLERAFSGAIKLLK